MTSPTRRPTVMWAAALLGVAALLLGLRSLSEFGMFDREPDLAAPVDEQRPTSPGIAEARRLLDRYTGDRRMLRQAELILTRELARDPDEPEALLQYARLLIMGAENGNELALEALQRIHTTSPDFAEAHVLRIHALTNLKRYDDAWKAVKRAHQLDSTSPWLAVNSGVLMVAQGRNEAGARTCHEVIERYRGREQENPKLMHGAYHCRRAWLAQSGQYGQLEAEFRTMIANGADDAWSLEEFADFLCRRRDCDEALVVIDRALARMEFGKGRETRAMIQYALWAKRVAAGTGDSVDAQRLLAEAEAVVPDPNDVMGRYGGKIDNAALVSALLAKGASIDALDCCREMPALANAAWGGDAESVRVLVAAGADVNFINAQGWSALMAAARTNNVAVAQALIEAGADSRSKPGAAWRITTEHQSHDVRKLLQASFKGQI